MKNRLLHPFLFPIFPVLALFAGNLLPWSSIGILLLPVAVSIGAALVFYFLMHRIFRNNHLAGALTTLFFLLFFSYGHLYELLLPTPLYKKLNSVSGIPLSVLVLTFLFIVGTAACMLLFRWRDKLQSVTGFLNFTVTILLLLPLFTMVSNHASVNSASQKEQENSAVTTATTALPNIYFLLMDGYAREDILQEVFDYDNRWFTDYLRSKGFFVADSSRTNYAQTQLSLSSALSMRYLQDIPELFARKKKKQAVLSDLIFNNEVFRTAKKLGYHTVSFDATMVHTLQVKNTDVYFQTPEASFFTLDYFHHQLLYLTPLRLLINQLEMQHRDSIDKHRNKLLNAFRNLKETTNLKGPVLVYAHIMAPHEPLVFGPKGEPVYPPHPYSLRHTQEHDPANYRQYHIKAYRDEVHYLNKRLQEIIDHILANSTVPPVILLQSDHGSWIELDMYDIEKTNLKERMSNLNALLVPCKTGEQLSHGITPVNTFRYVFRNCFNANLPPLPDSSYFSTWDKELDFIPLNRDYTYRK